MVMKHIWNSIHMLGKHGPVCVYESEMLVALHATNRSDHSFLDDKEQQMVHHVNVAVLDRRLHDNKSIMFQTKQFL